MVVLTDFCNDFVRENEVVVDRELLHELENQRTSIQRVVECLEDGFVLTFAVPTLELETLQVTRSIIVQGSSEELTALSCVDGPVFVVK